MAPRLRETRCPAKVIAPKPLAITPFGVHPGEIASTSRAGFGVAMAVIMPSTDARFPDQIVLNVSPFLTAMPKCLVLECVSPTSRLAPFNHQS
jgi:hypothetical protein